MREGAKSPVHEHKDPEHTALEGAHMAALLLCARPLARLPGVRKGIQKTAVFEEQIV